MWKKRGQVWVETVIYTLIAFAMMGLVLTYVKPKIEELQDQAIIEQSIVMLRDIDKIIRTVESGGSGNKRKIELGIKKGNIEIDGINDQIIFEIESKYTYSEPGKDVIVGNIVAHTEKVGTFNKITFVIEYEGNTNITIGAKDSQKIITKSSTTYNLFISNEGIIGGSNVINFEIE